jgi:hypothetical protein
VQHVVQRAVLGELHQEEHGPVVADHPGAVQADYVRVAHAGQLTYFSLDLHTPCQKFL